MPEYEFLCIFPIRHITAFLGLGALDSTLALCLRTSYTVTSLTKGTKNKALKRPQEGHLFSIRAVIRRQCHLVPPQLTTCMSDNSNFCSTAHVLQ